MGNKVHGMGGGIMRISFVYRLVLMGLLVCAIHRNSIAQQWNPRQGFSVIPSSSNKENAIRVGGFLRFAGFRQFLDSQPWTDHQTDNMYHGRLYGQYKKGPHTVFLSGQLRVFGSQEDEFGIISTLNNGTQHLLNLNTSGKGDIGLYHGQIDQYYYRYAQNGWKLQVGRQFIFWNKTVVWNPNDYLTTFSLLGFDIRNRGAIETAQIQKISSLSRSSTLNIEMIAAPSLDPDQGTYISRVEFRGAKGSAQLVGGKVLRDLSLGLGGTLRLGQLSRASSGGSYEISAEASQFLALPSFGGNASEDAFLCSLSLLRKHKRSVVALETMYHSNPTLLDFNAFSLLGTKTMVFNSFQTAALFQYWLTPKWMLGGNLIYEHERKQWNGQISMQIEILSFLRLESSFSSFNRNIGEQQVQFSPRNLWINSIQIRF